MRLSVVIPSFNRVELLSRAISSIYSQSWCASNNDFEVIVVDDGSTDKTVELITQQFPNVSIIHQQQLGVSAARNTGLKHAQGEWIALLDSDDEWLPHKLNSQFSLLERTDLLVCHTEEIWIRNGVRVNQMKKT